MRKLTIFIASLFILFFVTFGECANKSATALITAIEIEGTRRIDKETIKYQLKTQTGDRLLPLQIRQDIRNIFNIGYIDDVRVESIPFEGGIKLIYHVKEKPWVKKIIFKGNNALKEDDLKKKVDFKEKGFLDKNAIQAGIDKLIQYYHSEGFYLAEIDYELENLQDDIVNIIININEDKKIGINNISFSGNTRFSDRVLRKAIETKTHGFFSFITKRGFLNKAILQEDRIRLENFYMDSGFIKCKVLEPVVELDEEKKHLSIKFSIYEGDQFKVKDIAFSGNQIFTDETLRKVVNLNPGDIFSRSRLSKDIISITDAYGEKGYRTTNVFYSVSEAKEKKELSVTYKIKEGEPSFLRKINITGNHKTRDKVIRREMVIKEGDLLDTKRLKESYRRINNLGFFSQLDMKPIQSKEENYFDLDINVEERLTGQISLGAGYSSEDHLVGTFEIRQGNLFGRGQKLSAAAELGGESQTYNISFTEPYFFDKPLTLGSSLYYDIKEYDLYTRSARGGNLGFGFPVIENLRFYSEFTHEKINIHEVSYDLLQREKNDPESLSSYDMSILDSLGKSRTTSIAMSLYRDTRDDRFRPTTGTQNKLTFSYSGGFLGGDNWFYRTTLDSGLYFSLPWWKFVLGLHGNISYASGHSGRSLPVFERLYCGGQSTVRGYLQKGVGPKDKFGIPTGGNKRAVFNTELHFPIYEAIGGLLFFDTGNVFEEGEDFFAHSLRISAGMGIRIFTPMGPMRLDWGYKLLRQEDETPSDWHFAIGTYF